MTIEDKLLRNLAELTDTVNLHKKLWTIHEVAEYLNTSVDSARQRIVNQRNFPTPLRIPTKKGTMTARWQANEIQRWATNPNFRRA